MRRIPFRLVSCAALLAGTALAAPSAAQAAPDVSWEVASVPRKTASASTSSRLTTIWLDDKACAGSGAVMYRTRSGKGSWTGEQRLSKSCPDESASIDYPQIVSAGSRDYVFYSQVDRTSDKRSGVYVTIVSNKGRRVTAPRLLGKTPHASSPTVYAATVRNGRVWLMYNKPAASDSAKSRFQLEGYAPATGRLVTRNLAVGKGRFSADNASFNTTTGTMHIHAAKQGIVAAWQLTDVADETHWYVASAKGSGKLRYHGDIGLSSSTRVFSGDDSQLYKASEYRDKDSDTPVTSRVQKWSFASGGFQSAYADKLVAMVNNDIQLKRLLPSYYVDRQGSLYVSTIEFPFGNDCRTSGQVFEPCVRWPAPQANAGVLRVVKTTAGGGQQSMAQVPWATGAKAAGGSSVVQWYRSVPGLERITSLGGGVRIMGVEGREFISPSGSILQPEAYAVMLSDPLRFDQTPSFDPAAHNPPPPIKTPPGSGTDNGPTIPRPTPPDDGDSTIVIPRPTLP